MRPLRLLAVLACAALLAPAAAMAGDKRPPRPAPAASEDPGPEMGPFTWYRDVLPLVQTHCQLCHAAGGVGPFPLLTYEEAKANAKDMAQAVRTSYMPPWMPADGCQSFRDARRLTRAEVNVITSWVADGAPPGSPGDAPPPLPAEATRLTLPQVSATMNAGADYLPVAPPGTDEFRCFVLDPRLARDRDLIGIDIDPGADRQVHHASVYAAAAEDVLEADRADPSLGWVCPGVPNVESPQLIGVWAAGASVTRYPAGTGIPVKAKSLFILQVHYNVPPGAPAQPDRTQVRVQYAPQRVERQGVLLFASKSNFAIPPKAAGFTLSTTYPMAAGYTLLGVYPHMHQLGRRIRVERNGNCVIDIPFWEAGSQQFYFLDSPSGIQVNATDALKINCVWNNPLPKKVGWGEGALSEMCSAYLYLTH